MSFSRSGEAGEFVLAVPDFSPPDLTFVVSDFTADVLAAAVFATGFLLGCSSPSNQTNFLDSGFFAVLDFFCFFLPNFFVTNLNI